MSIRERIMAADGQWLMGQIMPRELLQGIGKYLHRVAPEREDELIAAIKTRAEELIEANEDMVVDGPAEGMLGISAVVLAAFEILRPEFDGDERRTILYLQHVFGTVLRRTFEATFEWITSRENPLDDYEKAVRKQRPMYGSYFEMPLERQDPGTFEMRVERCFFHDFFARHDARLVTTVLCAWDANTLGDRPGGQRSASRGALGPYASQDARGPLGRERPSHPAGDQIRRSPCRRLSARVRSATRSSRLSESRRRTSESASGSTAANSPLREAARARWRGHRACRSCGRCQRSYRAP
jgi:hypothetical protein